MTFFKRNGDPMPKAIVEQAAKVGDDPVNRREFLALASAFGATAATVSAPMLASSWVMAASRSPSAATAKRPWPSAKWASTPTPGTWR